MNTVELVGRTTKDITVSVKGETKMARFTIAVNEGKDKTVFIPVTAFGKTAENMVKYVGKGSLISVEGHVSVSRNEDKMYINIVANKVEYLSTKKPGTANTAETGAVPDVTYDDIQF